MICKLGFVQRTADKVIWRGFWTFLSKKWKKTVRKAYRCVVIIWILLLQKKSKSVIMLQQSGLYLIIAGFELLLNAQNTIQYPV